MLDLQIIGAIVICLFVIGLAGALVIGCKVSKNNENITGRDVAGRDPGTGTSIGPVNPQDKNYYPGFLGLWRYRQKPGRDLASLYGICPNFDGQDPGLHGQDSKLFKNF